MNFPQYRKYPHNKTFFKINSPLEFDELQIIENNFTLIKLVAKILPDRNYINDMLENIDKHWLVSSKEEFDKQLEFCEKNLTQL